MVVVNMGHGPDRDECQRFAQVQDMMSFLFEFFTPDSCLLFEHYASAMLDELGTLVPIDVGQAPTEAGLLEGEGGLPEARAQDEVVPVHGRPARLGRPLAELDGDIV